MLNDREKLILHFCCTITIAKLTGLPHRDTIVEKMISDIRKERCRSLSEKDVISLLDEINEEMLGGKNMFKHLIDERKHITGKEIRNITGERPNKNTSWSDMR